MDKIRKSRRGRYGAMATLITVLGIALIIAANVVVNLLSDRYQWAIDLTSNDRYELSEESREIVSNLDADVSVVVMQDEESMATGSSYVVQAYQLLREYERASSHLTLEFVDLVSNPTFGSLYGDLDLRSWDILVTAGENREVLAMSELYDYSEDGSSITASRVEAGITNAILTVTTGEKTRLTVLTGYGDTYPDALVRLLEDNRFEVEDQSLVTDAVDPEAEAALLFSPEKDPEASSLDKLDEWLENGGEQGKSLYVFLDPTYEDLPNLAEFLEEWGIGLGEGYVFEANSSLYYERFYYPVAQYADEDFASGLTSSDLTILALCRPLQVLWETHDNYTTSVLLEFSPLSGSLALGATEVSEEDITGDEKGMILSSHSWYGSEVTTSHVVVSGSCLAFEDALLGTETFANSEYILRVFQRLSSQSFGLSLLPTDLTTQVHSMTAAQARLAVLCFLVILPALVLAVGALVWLRRRNR